MKPSEQTYLVAKVLEDLICASRFFKASGYTASSVEAELEHLACCVPLAFLNENGVRGSHWNFVLDSVVQMYFGVEILRERKEGWKSFLLPGVVSIFLYAHEVCAVFVENNSLFRICRKESGMDFLATTECELENWC